MFVAHVGDSKVVVGTRSKTHPATLEALILTEDHHPTIKSERERIQASGGGITRYNMCTMAQGQWGINPYD